MRLGRGNLQEWWGQQLCSGAGSRHAARETWVIPRNRLKKGPLDWPCFPWDLPKSAASGIRIQWVLGVQSIQFSSVAQSCPILCNPMDHSTSGLPIHHQLLDFTQTHVHWVSDAIQPSHLLSFPFSSHLQSFPASGSFPMSQLFASGGQSIGTSASTSVLPMNIQGWSPLGWTGWISLQSKGLSRVFSNITVQKHQFFNTQLFLQSNSHIHTWPLEKP